LTSVPRLVAFQQQLDGRSLVAFQHLDRLIDRAFAPCIFFNEREVFNMAAIHMVTMSLPNTTAFHEKEDVPPQSDEREKPIQRHSSADLTTASLPRYNSAVDLTTRPSATNLFGGTTPPLTPGAAANAAAQEFFSPATADSSTLKRQLSKFGDLARSDIDELQREHAYNQPQSRAAPLPSGSILDFAKVHEQLTQEKLKQAKGKHVSPPRARTGRANSSERGFENKTWTIETAIHGNGGLTNAMRVASEGEGVDIHWIGTLGFPTDALPDHMKDGISDQLLNEHHSSVVFVTDKDFNGHYTAYCKTILWPIFHYQVPDHPKSKAYADHSWEFYRNVNQAFADKVIESYKEGDTIWINDYHLLLVPGMVRKKHPKAMIGFFLHTAFPSSEIFRCLAMRKDLLDGMLGANLIVFQTEEYATHFLQTCSRILTVETTSEGVQLEDHFVNVMSEPIGINPAALDEARKDEEVTRWINEISGKYKDKLLIVARDKLDNVHGVRQKLLSYELFLGNNPEMAKKTVLIQVATSTSEQRELLTVIGDICTRIDGKYASLTHQPLVFLKQDIDFCQYLALLSVADVLMVTPLRDGMNLTAHEYVCCQDGRLGAKKHGTVILSEFTGSASLFKTQFSVNPWDYKKMANAIKYALDAEEEEKAIRWNQMHAVVEARTGKRWAETLQNALIKVHKEHHQRASTSVPRLSTAMITEKYKDAESRVFIIDYEGTLAPHKTREGIPLVFPTRVVDTLNDLLSDPKNTVYVMSGRSPEELDNAFRTASELGLIAENGCFVRRHGAPSRAWEVAVDMEEVYTWKAAVKTILTYYSERMEGSSIEERNCSVIFHYDKVEDQEGALRQAGECADQINSGCKTMHIQAVPINKAVLIEMSDFSKATAAENIYKTIVAHHIKDPLDFLMVAGDDREDEVVFRWANKLYDEGEVEDVFTVSVGRRNTEAQAAVTQGSTGLLAVLQKLAKVSLDSVPTDYFNNPQKAGQ
jgi:trehalose 6-phosphate synthase complex regulatory subunit